MLALHSITDRMWGAGGAPDTWRLELRKDAETFIMVVCSLTVSLLNPIPLLKSSWQRFVQR
jgi:hypothetical protein